MEYYFKRIIVLGKKFIWDRINLFPEKEDELKTIETISKGVSFHGTKLWILVFAIGVASVGLNTNSTAVIIGAMLISPLMGPIMGIGLSLGIYDFELLKKSLLNLTVATIASIIASTAYFVLSPIDTAQSELLARTSPTIYDVLIAFFGGLAGIVAGASTEKGNVIPGVAIATALMPPLCTVGYGFATMQTNFIFGAFYLFLINSIFIALATFLIVRYLKFPIKDFVDKKTEKKIKKIITLVLVVILVPSLYTAYLIIVQSAFTGRSTKFINEQFHFKGTVVIHQEFDYSFKEKIISVTLFGKKIDSNKIKYLISKLPDYNLDGSELNILQSEDEKIDIAKLQASIKASLQTNNPSANFDKIIEERNLEIDLLKQKLSLYVPTSENEKQVFREMIVNYPSIASFSLLKGNINMSLVKDSIQTDTLLCALIKFKTRKVNKSEVQKINDWLKIRLNNNKVQVINFE